MKWANWISIVVIALIMFFNAGDLASYLSSPDEYHFGTEVAGFSYRSPQHFVGWIVAVLLIGGAAVASGAFIKRRAVAVAIRSAVALVLVVASFAYLRT